MGAFDENFCPTAHFVRSARKTTISDIPMPSELLQSNPFATPKMLVHHLIHNSPVLTELVVTREWLQETAPSPQPVESASAYRNFTRLNILHNQRVGPMGRQANLVKELDPDVTIREASMTLAAEDAVRWELSLRVNQSMLIWCR